MKIQGQNFEFDCGDNSCLYAENRTGMRTNGGCRCHESLRFRVFTQMLFAENAKLKIALWEAIHRPLGVVPDSATEFFDFKEQVSV